MSIRSKKSLLASSLMTLFLVGCNSSSDDTSGGDPLSSGDSVQLELTTLTRCSVDEAVAPTEADYRAAVAACSPSATQSTFSDDSTYFRVNSKSQVRSFEAQSDGTFVYHYIGAGGDSGTATTVDGATRFDWGDSDDYFLITVLEEDAKTVSALIYDYYYNDDTGQYETEYYSSLFGKDFTPTQCTQRDNPEFETNLTQEYAVTKTELETLLDTECRVTLGGRYAKFDEARLIKANDVYSGDGDGDYERFVFTDTDSASRLGWFDFEIRDKDDVVDIAGEWMVDDEGVLLLALEEEGTEYIHQLHITATDGFTTMVKVFSQSDAYINQGFAADVGSLSSLVFYSQEPDF
ncbi:hypothetical protein ACP3V5_16820 [Vibrio maritimus]